MTKNQQTLELKNETQQALQPAVPPMATGGRIKNRLNAYGYALVKDFILGL